MKPLKIICESLQDHVLKALQLNWLSFLVYSTIFLLKNLQFLFKNSSKPILKSFWVFSQKLSNFFCRLWISSCLKTLINFEVSLKVCKQKMINSRTFPHIFSTKNQSKLITFTNIYSVFFLKLSLIKSFQF